MATTWQFLQAKDDLMSPGQQPDGRAFDSVMAYIGTPRLESTPTRWRSVIYLL